jgi:hypothetical protein
MATVSWKNASTGNWNTAANWSNGAVPTSADTVTIGFGSSTSSTFTVTEDALNALASTLKIDGDTQGGAHSVTLSMVGNTLTVGTTILLNNDQSIINGNGTISAGGAISGSGTITATGGVLDLTGAGSLSSGPVLTIGTAAGSTLEINLTGGATSAGAISITNSNQTLEVGPSGSLTISTAETVQSGKILMAGGKLTDSSGITLGGLSAGGSLSGSGTVAANLSLSGSLFANGAVIASGGTLDLTGTFGAGLVASIDTGSASDLKFDGTATSNSAISITSATQTLEIGNSGALTIGAAQNVALGTIKLDGGSLTDSSGVSFGSGTSNGTLSGFGTVTGTLTRSGTGTADTITATGGTLTLANAIGASSGLVFDIGNTGTAAPSRLRLSGATGTGNTFTFLGPTGVLNFNNSAVVTENVGALNVGTSKTTPTNFIDLLGTLTVKGSNVHTGTSGSIALSNGDTLTVSGITGNTGGTWYVNTKSDGAGGTDVFLSIVCYAAGTRILTATGERVVESLLQGDIVLTLADGELIARPIKWVGRRRIDLTAHPRPETVAPIRIRCGAFAEAMPHTDLLMSPDHAIFVDGKLICARQLVNGTTIIQEQDWTSVDYYHVELDAHAILLAEGLPAESYLDTGNRGFFGNADAPLILHPDLTDERDYPARELGSCAPFVSDEADVRPVWQRLADRAAALGQPVAQPETTTDPAPCLIARGRTVKPMYGENGLYIFALPKGATEVRLVSHAAAPTDVRPWLEDRRRLGLYVERIVLRGADEVREVPVDHPSLSRGWWAVERSGTALHRWTDGDAMLPLPEMAGPAMLEVRAGSAGLSYPVQPIRQVRAA